MDHLPAELKLAIFASVLEDDLSSFHTLRLINRAFHTLYLNHRTALLNAYARQLIGPNLQYARIISSLPDGHSFQIFRSPHSPSVVSKLSPYLNIFVERVRETEGAILHHRDAERAIRTHLDILKLEELRVQARRITPSSKILSETFMSNKDFVASLYRWFYRSHPMRELEVGGWGGDTSFVYDFLWMVVRMHMPASHRTSMGDNEVAGLLCEGSLGNLIKYFELEKEEKLRHVKEACISLSDLDAHAEEEETVYKDWVKWEFPRLMERMNGTD